MRQLVCTFAVVAFAFGVTARAEMLRAKVPFNLEMSGAVLPAGELQIKIMDDCRVQVLNSNSFKGALACANKLERVKRDAGCKLVIYKYGDRAFLKEVWSINFVQVIPRSRQERELVTSRITAHIRPVRVDIIATSE